MKKFVGLLMLMLLCVTAALGETTLNPGEVRNITINKAGLNPVIEGYSPTTGRALSEIEAPDGFAGLAVTGRYMPMLVQVDNSEGGTGYRAPWNAEYADVIYETPLYRGGNTRMSFLFSDTLPNEAGPVRSARVEHAWLREEWDCGFCHYGQQEYAGTNVQEVFRSTGAKNKGVLFNGTVGLGKAWKKYYKAVEGLKSPHDKIVDAASVSTLIPEDFTAANHTWLFSDAAVETGDEATAIYVTWGSAEYNSYLEYDAEENCYYRYMMQNPKKPELYVDYLSKNAITFSNVIVQFIDCSYPTIDAPLPTVTGTGNADYFIAGRHIAGVWQRDDLASRTVFYDQNGDELQLNVGRTLIITFDGQTSGRSISFE